MPPSTRLLPATLGSSLFIGATLACASPTALTEIEINSQASADDPRLAEVSTATRTTTPVRYVPQAIDSVKVANLTVYGIRDLGTALSGIPNVSNGADTRFDSLRIRGFDASNDFYLDGIRDDSQYVRDLHNIERIDVLKGPAAVLYGRGSQGGIINRISKTPEFGRRSTIEVQGGSEDMRSLYADLSADPSENTSLRLNVGNLEGNGFGDGVSSNRHLFAPSMRLQLNPDLNWLLQYEYNRHNRTPDRGIPGIGGRPAQVRLDTTYGHEGDFIDDKAQSLRSRLAYEVNDQWQLRHTLGVFKLDSDFDNTFLTGYDTGKQKVTQARWQQDLTTRNLFNNVEMEGAFDTLGLEHRVLAGVETGHQRRDPKLYKASVGGEGSSAVPAQDLYYPDRRLRHSGRMVASSDNHTEVHSQGIYLQDQLRLNDQWQLLSGLRHDHFQVQTTNRLAGISERRGSRSISPRVGLVWTPWQDHSLYASWSKTFSPAGGGLIGITPGAPNRGNDLSPEMTRQTEIGIKSDWREHGLSSTLAVYELELYNRRTRNPHDPSLMVLTGLQRSRGIELTSAGNLVGNLYLRGGIGIQNATIVKDNNGQQGKRVKSVARRNGNLFLTWKPEAGWYGETGLTFVGQRYADNLNTTVLPGYGRWDAQVGYRSKEWDITAALNNLNDKRYFPSATSASQIKTGEPRNVVVSTTYTF
jgi:iron complex outermembrane receptor protein